ncbi:hypothetical protein BN12_400007 [Nostocoides japonicum T1-X7]|uniref:Uncharacterized protein n=1 Tax=Nostocoides japonicum T1-X7 TaxID=1194083 RepID=A0A077LYW0_9MICO|nr:hypothetical protein [Tetrasphaera japonica]CCH79098.1 hypothetical protein BN12_400007 [Tetrasphaera japonica T1-X7]
MTPAEEVETTETIALIEVEDLFALDDGRSWIEGSQGLTIGSVSCPATVASAFCFT